MLYMRVTKAVFCHDLGDLFAGAIIRVDDERQPLVDRWVALGYAVQIQEDPGRPPSDVRRPDFDRVGNRLFYDDWGRASEFACWDNLYDGGGDPIDKEGNPLPKKLDKDASDE